MLMVPMNDGSWRERRKMRKRNRGRRNNARTSKIWAMGSGVGQSSPNNTLSALINSKKKRARRNIQKEGINESMAQNNEIQKEN